MTPRQDAFDVSESLRQLIEISSHVVAGGDDELEQLLQLRSKLDDVASGVSRRILDLDDAKNEVDASDASGNAYDGDSDPSYP